MSTPRVFTVAITCTLLGACADSDVGRLTAPVYDASKNAMVVKRPDNLDLALRSYLAQLGYTGRIASTLEVRLGRKIDRQLADVGRMLWFDPITALRGDNACAGCHSPTHGFGDTQSIAIGIDNNGIVGQDRRGPRNQRRSPMMLNSVFFPTLMWNSRFRSLSGDPFDNSVGFQFPPPEEGSLSPLAHLLVAQAFIPPTERVEAAGFEFPGDNDAIRGEVLRRLDASAYRQLFGHIFPEIRRGAPITFEHFGRAIAEFEFTQVYADAPIDRYARGISNALSDAEKSGAVLFFGRANCVSCHKVSGSSNEMFSDFREHVIGVPQVSPSLGNMVFDGPGRNEDFGLEQVTGREADRYGFRTSPLRNVALQPTFMHNGAFVRLEDAIRHHLDAYTSARGYSPAGLAPDLRGPTGPIEPVLERLDPLLRTPLHLSDTEVADLVAFVGNGLLDPEARPTRLRRLIPERLPSGLPLFVFQFR